MCSICHVAGQAKFILRLVDDVNGWKAHFVREHELRPCFWRKSSLNIRVVCHIRQRVQKTGAGNPALRSGL
eukprot:1583645-Heterocapsa_arctica.AAC.1